MRIHTRREGHFDHSIGTKVGAIVDFRLIAIREGREVGVRTFRVIQHGFDTCPPLGGVYLELETQCVAECLKRVAFMADQCLPRILKSGFIMADSPFGGTPEQRFFDTLRFE